MSEWKFEIESGTQKRLLTAGNYCDRDILISAFGGSDGEPVLQEKSATPTKAAQSITPDDGYDGLSRVNVAAIPDAYIIPGGTVAITQNGEHNVREAEKVKVSVYAPEPVLQEKNVTPVKGTQTVTPDAGYDGLSKVNVGSIPDAYIIPSGTVDITANGTHNVREAENVNVSVPIPEPVLQQKSVTPTKTAQTVAPDSGYDGLSAVNVKAIPDKYIIPNGTLSIAENGTYDATEYASVVVNVAGSGGETEPDYRELYQRVEYITTAEAETYPYIVTDFVVDNTCGAEIIASFPIMQDRIPMGSREDSGNTRFYVVYPLSSTSVYYGFNAGASISCSLKTDTVYRLQTNFMNSRLVNVYEENGTRKANASISQTLTQHTVPLAIFGYNSASSGAVSSKREYKLYGARCSRGHEVVREYIPCYRKSDVVVGVYEKFTGQFLTSDIDAGFAKGADIAWDS